MFRLFHCASVGAPKIFAFFSCFLASCWVFKWVLKIEYKQLATSEKNISSPSDFRSPTQLRSDLRAKEMQRAQTTKRLPLLHFPANRCGADSLHFLAGRSPERRLEIFFSPPQQLEPRLGFLCYIFSKPKGIDIVIHS
ncbi:hypothetical protein BBR47_42360 [Brevibacillus brevis NBRC 100599]|uniref:Uncharacterized protein n=1 Tax=Brevibacillus brevis (strain 47 / JCM 6285 / NBRC 100599) TaxID=358681 RepID=C0ZHT9_BREBN|nr:hypothetical protein BBR47_42360 [Brevibacillus brevis NBRC 100599]